MSDHKCAACGGSGSIEDCADGPNRPSFDECERCRGTGLDPTAPPIQTFKDFAREAGIDFAQWLERRLKNG